MKVYISGPITKGHRLLNIRNAVQVGAEVMRAGHTPFIPHLFDFIDMITDSNPMDYEAWMRFDIEWLETCDILLRIPGESSGADREIEHMEKLGRPVVYITELSDVREFLARFKS